MPRSYQNAPHTDWPGVVVGFLWYSHCSPRPYEVDKIHDDVTVFVVILQVVEQGFGRLGGVHPKVVELLCKVRHEPNDVLEFISEPPIVTATALASETSTVEVEVVWEMVVVCSNGSRRRSSNWCRHSSWSRCSCWVWQGSAVGEVVPIFADLSWLVVRWAPHF